MKPVRNFSVLLVSACLWAAPMQAQSRLQTFTQGLVQQGYKNVTVSRTFLGRSRITANKGNTSREIILSTSGRVLRDDSRVDLSISLGENNSKQGKKSTADMQNNENSRDSENGDGNDGGNNGGGSDNGNDSGSDNGGGHGSDDGGNGNDGGHGGGSDGGDGGGGSDGGGAGGEGHD